MTIPQQAVEAAANAMSKASPEVFSGEAWRFLAQVALEAALPALEQQIREQ